MLAAVEADCPVAEYTPAEVKRAVVGYGRAEKHQVAADGEAAARARQGAVPHDASDALAVAIVPRARAPPDRPGARGCRPPTRRRRWRLATARAPKPPALVAAVSSARARMIAFLRGQILDKQPNRVTVDVHGVGYDVHVPLSTYYQIGEAGIGGGAPHLHARPRGSAAALRLLDGPRAPALRAPDRHQRHRAEAGRVAPVGHGHAGSARPRCSAPTSRA